MSDELHAAAAACPRLDVREHGAAIEVLIAHHPDDELRAQLAALFAHPAVASYRRVSLCATGPTQPETDFRWALDAIGPATFDQLFVGSARIMTFDGAAVGARAGRLASASWATYYEGTFPGIRVLDLRHGLLTWRDCVWPDLEVLVLRPRHAARGGLWARSVLGSAASFPRLREVRFPENDGDELVAALLESPMLPQLRCVDATDNISDRGAEVLHRHADRVAHLDELWIGSTGDRRRTATRMNPATEFPRGTLEIDHAWASRLRGKLGEILRFKPRAGHPDL